MIKTHTIAMIHDLSNTYIILLVFLDMIFPTLMNRYALIIALVIGIVAAFYTRCLIKKRGVRYDHLARYFAKLDNTFSYLLVAVYVGVYIFNESLSNVYIFSAFIFFTGVYIGFKIMLYIMKFAIWGEF